MNDRPPNHRDIPVKGAAAKRLRAYLADRDVNCTACGYNLRGATSVLCPECGDVIASPPHELPKNELALQCHRCGASLAYHRSAAACPGCGAADITLADARERATRYDHRLDRVPGVLRVCAALGVVVALGKLVTIVVMRHNQAANPAMLALSVPVALVPALVAKCFVADWGLRRTNNPQNIASRRRALSVAGVVMLALAVAMA